MKTAAAILLTAMMADLAVAEVFQDFRGRGPDETLFRLEGAGAERNIKIEPEGLRLAIPADQPSAIGIATRFPFRGDFQITLSYELLQADRPEIGSGVGLEVYLDTDTPAQHALVFHHIVRPKEGEVYFCDRKVTDASGKRLTDRKQFPAAGKSGRLRLTRTGKQVAFELAEEGAGEFQELCQHEFADAVKSLHVRAFHGKSQKLVDLRILDLRIRTAQEVLAAESRSPRVRLWLLIGAGSGILLVSLLIWWRMRRKRSPAGASSTA